MKAAEDVYILLHFLFWWLAIPYKIRLMHKIQYGLVYTMLPKKKYVSNVLFYQQLDQIYCILTNQSRYNLYHCSHSLFLPKAVNLFKTNGIFFFDEYITIFKDGILYGLEKEKNVYKYTCVGRFTSIYFI